MPKPVQFTRGNKFGEREGDYDPEEWRRRDPNVSELSSDSTKSRVPGQRAFSPEGPVGDLDAVPAESSQRKALLGLEHELESLQKSAASLDVSLVDQPMTVSSSPQPIKSSGIPAVDKIREQTAQIDFDYETKSALRSGGVGSKLTTNPDFFKEDGSAKTYREFYEEKINEKVSQIEVEKSLMGENYEQQALKKTVADRSSNIGEVTETIDHITYGEDAGFWDEPSETITTKKGVGLDEVDLELATSDTRRIKEADVGAPRGAFSPSIANPNQMSTNPGFRGEIHSVKPEGTFQRLVSGDNYKIGNPIYEDVGHGPIRNPINKPPQITRADTSLSSLFPATDPDSSFKFGETGYTGLEPEGYSPMNPTVQGSGETPQEVKRRIAAAQRKAATKKIKGKTVYTGETKGAAVVPDDPALEIEAVKDSDNTRLSGFDPDKEIPPITDEDRFYAMDEMSQMELYYLE